METSNLMSLLRGTRLDGTPTQAIMAQAANEIERLRAEAAEPCMSCRAQEAETERLREALLNARSNLEPGCGEDCDCFQCRALNSINAGLSAETEGQSK